MARKRAPKLKTSGRSYASLKRQRSPFGKGFGKSGMARGRRRLGGGGQRRDRKGRFA